MSILKNLFGKKTIDIPNLGEFIISRYNGSKAATRKMTDKMGVEYKLIFILNDGVLSDYQKNFFANFKDDWEKIGVKSQNITKSQEAVTLKKLTIMDINDNKFNIVCEAETSLCVLEFEKNELK